ncbi:PIG-L deacetylase family protein [[Archangium] primigenium]|uniref:PIG-L deacetylase family protein n=1 Tax=Melittangium TaxID=44 RepID=UPI00195B027E|nr:PIG-L family deacetylase [Archangium primigenium]MBM7119428.1 PIG-L family deacetylase [Archangium primigenium]
MDAVNSRRIVGEGTSAREWASWSGLELLPAVDPATLVPRGRRAIIVAPHPDDEVLGTGGLLARLGRLGREVVLVAVTDGTASHPGSSLWPVDRLATARPRETQEALLRLGLAGVDVERLEIPDGGITAHESRLMGLLGERLQPGDVVFATWRLDGHPDHEAVGRAAFRACAALEAHLVEVPIWTWHWAKPGDARVPWSRARRILLDEPTLTLKRRATAAYVSQLDPDPSTGKAPILPPYVLARLLRPFEVVLT